MVAYTTECVESRAEKDWTQYGRFVMEPLERGQGTTLGNALRRVLLSNLEGSSVTAVRITGVNHEFATLYGVREDVLDILLNMKELVLRSYTSELQVGRLAITGPKIVTAGDLELPSELEVVNPYHSIAHLSEGAQLEMEFQVERGKGYRAVDRSNNAETVSVDYLALDAVFMPVRKVNYTVDATLVGDNLNNDRLTLEIWTNGSITPQEALSQAARILVDLLKPLQEITFESLIETPKSTQEKTAQIAIEELQLSVRAYNCLKRAQINYVSDLLQFTEDDLLEIKNFGQKSAEEVIDALREKLGMTLPKERPVRS